MTPITPPLCDQSTAMPPDTFQCEGCGKPLTYTGRGRKPKWCSGRCRKKSYGDPCVDCGARTNYGSEKARVAQPHCDDCRTRRRAAGRCERVLAMLAARSKGLTNKEIAEHLDIPVKTVASELSRLSALGFDVPAAAYNDAVRTGAQIGYEAETLGRALAANGVDVPAFREAMAA